MPSDYNERLRNRNYKRSVIIMITERIAETLRLRSGYTLIVDFVGCPVSFQADPDNPNKPMHTYLTDIPPNGECDIKFTRWARCYGDMIAHSVDGDFIPIALMEHEKQLMVEEVPSPIRIAIFRLEYNMEAKTPAGAAMKKRKLEAMQQATIGADGRTVAPGAQKQDQKKQGRRMEFVNIPVLYNVLFNAMRQCAPTGADSGSYRRQYMRILSCLIGMTGTDFSRSLPHLGPKKVWDMLSAKHVWPGLLRSYDVSTGQMVPGDMCDHFVRHLYIEKFSKHADGDTLDEVLQSLARSKLAERTKTQLPSLPRVDVTMRNINWLLWYWECQQPLRATKPETEDEKENAKIWIYDHLYPDPIQEQYGFKKSKDRKCAVQWLDVV